MTVTKPHLFAAIAHYREHGYARLGKVCPNEQLAGLRARADEVMRGEVVYPGLFFQHDTTTGAYGDLTYGQGLAGAVARVPQDREAREGSALRRLAR